MSQYVPLKTENDFCNSIIESNHALLFSESTENGIIIKAKVNGGTFTNVIDPRANGLKAGFETLTGESLASIAAGITSLNNSKTSIRNAIAGKGQTCTSSTPLADYAGLISSISGGSRIYKCASVGSGTWTGYLATIDSTTGVTTFASTTTSLTWSFSPAPQVGKVYTADGSMEVTVYEGAGRNGMIFYAPLHSSQATAETGQTMTQNGSVNFTTVGGISALSNGGGSNYISLPDTGLPSGSADRTISCLAYAYVLSGDNPRIFSYGTPSANNSCILNMGYHQKGGMEYWGGEAYTPVLQTNTWYHIVGQLSGGITKIYLNGVLSEEKTMTADTILNGTAYIGYLLTNTYFNGATCELKVWNRAITQAEITAEYNKLQAMVTA